MAAIHVPLAVAPNPQSVFNSSEGNGQHQRVEQATKGIFQRIGESFGYAWNQFVFGIGFVGGKISFVCFRVIEWIHPQWGLRAENVWLRVKDAWKSFKDQWKQKKTERQMQTLAQENHQNKVEALTSTQEAKRLKLECERFQRECELLKQKNLLLQRQIKAVEQQDMGELYNISVQQRELLCRENEQLKQQMQEKEQDFQKQIEKLDKKIKELTKASQQAQAVPGWKTDFKELISVLRDKQWDKVGIDSHKKALTLLFKNCETAAKFIRESMGVESASCKHALKATQKSFQDLVQVFKIIHRLEE